MDQLETSRPDTAEEAIVKAVLDADIEVGDLRAKLTEATAVRDALAHLVGDA